MKVFSLPRFVSTTLFILINFSAYSFSTTIKNGRYTKCRETYKCGGDDIVYPFYTSAMPEYCGYSGFMLGCDDGGNKKTITIKSHTYTIFKINGNNNTLTLARNDLLVPSTGPTCPSSWDSVSIDFTRFSYTGKDQNLTFFYNCDQSLKPNFQLPSWKAADCNSDQNAYPWSSGSSTIVGYCLTKKLELEYGRIISSNCSSHVKVPIMEAYASTIEATHDVNYAFKQGFELAWLAENDKCNSCKNSGGVCGTTDDSPNFACHCPDRTYTAGSKFCNSSAWSHKTVAIIVGVSVGVGLLLAFACIYAFCIKRKRQLVTNAETKDISAQAYSVNGIASSSGLQSSKGYTSTRTTNYSQSTSSYVSSRSDIERGVTSYFGVHLFNYDELEEATGHFDEAKELGDGGFGTVYYGKLKDGRLVAVKRLYENSFKRVGQFMNEVEILAHLRHKNLVTLYGCTSRRSRELLLVYEYICNGTVADHIHGKLADTTHLSWAIRLNIAIETADALAFLHASDVIHRDVKTTNILLDENFCVKVADFGLSRLFPTDVTHVSTAPQGTPGYVDPEYYQCYRLTEKSDVYSFGVVLIELISSKQAVDITRHRHHINLSNLAVDKIQNSQLRELVDPNIGFDCDYGVQQMVTAVAELAFRCLQQERDMRPTMTEVLDALKDIQKVQKSREKQDVVDILGKDDEDVVGLLKNVPPPFSPPEGPLGAVKGGVKSI